MSATSLPLPDEPRALRALVRTVLEQSPDTALPLVVDGEWIADPLWEGWHGALAARGMDRAQFGAVVAGYGNELRLWVVGERPWAHYVSGVAGRAIRRLPAPAPAQASGHAWQIALQRVGITPDDEMTALVARIGELHLLYDIAAPCKDHVSTAIVWAGARPRDPEAPFGEGRAACSAAALAEALGRFLVKDPAYPPR
jgi:hypothetical protein